MERVARTYRKSEGDVASMIRTILQSEEFWSREHFQAKFKTPQEFVISALRVTGAEVEDTGQVRSWLSRMGQPLYHCDDPTGWYDTAEAWLDPGVMAQRWEFALALAEDRLDGVRVPRSFHSSLPTEGSPLQWMRAMTQRILPAGASSRTYAMLYDVIGEHAASGSPIDYGALGPEVAARQDRTAVLVMTEFGRTAAQNGSNGTDHGHGSGMLLFGGGALGGKVHGDWKGLAPEQLYEGRDLPVTTDFRDVLAEVLRELFEFKPPRDFFPDHSPRRLRLF